MRYIATLAISLFFSSLPTHAQAGCAPITGNSWMIPVQLPFAAILTGNQYQVTWDGCDTKAFCFEPSVGPGGTLEPAQWGGADLTDWKIAVKMESEMPGYAGFANPSTKVISISDEVVDDPAQLLSVITHEMYHVAISQKFPVFDSAYGVCICPVLCENPNVDSFSHPQCFPCTWANEQVASCTSAQALCCKLGDSELTAEEREIAEDALAIARSNCADDLAQFPNAMTGCPVPAEDKPTQPVNAPAECPPEDCPTPAMEELGDDDEE